MFKSNSKLFDFQGKTLAALPPADPLPMLLLVEGEMHQETDLLHQVPTTQFGPIWEGGMGMGSPCFKRCALF